MIAEKVKMPKLSKKAKKRIITCTVIAAAAVVIFMMIRSGGKGVGGVPTMTLEPMTLANTVNLTGTIESDESMNVYSTSMELVKEINVEVGDRVEAGDILAQLDTQELELTVAKTRASVNQAAQSAQLSLSMSEKAYNNAKQNLEDELNSALLSAEANLRRAQQELNDARRDYNDNKDDQEYADSIMQQVERKLDRARDAMKDAEREWKKAGEPATGEIAEKYEKAEEEYQAAYKEWMDADTEYGGEVSTIKKTYRNARIDYENALAQRDAAQRSVQEALEEAKDNVTANKIRADLTAEQLDLQLMEKRLEDATIKSPISGTVTAVYAKQGMPGSGLLFVVENTDDLIIKTTIKEYDVASVQLGMPATIKTDGTGEEVFDGEVSMISPVAVKDAQGNTKTDAGVEFDTQIKITSPNSGLKVGMHTRMTIIVQQKDNVYGVPYDAVVTNPDGTNSIYIAQSAEEGKYIAVAVPVTVGMESDFYSEISSDQIKDGDLVITDTSTVIPGSEIILANSPITSEAAVE